MAQSESSVNLTIYLRVVVTGGWPIGTCCVCGHTGEQTHLYFLLSLPKLVLHSHLSICVLEVGLTLPQVGLEANFILRYLFFSFMESNPAVLILKHAYPGAPETC
jgi:hypothetical protein